MFLTILLRMLLILAISYLIGLLMASWLISLFQIAGDDGGISRGNERRFSTMLPDRDAISRRKHRQKWWVEVDESYYLEEFDLSHKHHQD